MEAVMQYTIRPYDTIWMLAQVFNTTVESIMDLNPGINPTNLQIGHVISIAPGYRYYPTRPEGRPVELMPGGTMPRDQRPSGPTPNGTMPGGTMPREQRPSGPTSNGMTPNENINSYQNMPGGQMPYGNMRDGMDDDMFDDMDYMGFMDTYNYFRMLWSQHYFWTMYVIEAIIFDLPTLEAGIDRLLRNPVDFANAIMPYYGEQAAAELEELLTSHLTIAAEVVQAAKAGDNNAYNNAQNRWHENADQLAAFLGNLNPYWSEEDWNAMLYDHLDLLTTAVGDLLSENYIQAISIYDDIELQIYEMSDMFIEGLLAGYME